MKPDRLDQLFKAVSDPARLRLLNLLRLGSICVCELQALLQIPQSTVSRHLAGLRHAGVVTDSRSGNRIIYSLASAGTPQIAAAVNCSNQTRMTASAALCPHAAAACGPRGSFSVLKPQ